MKNLRERYWVYVTFLFCLLLQIIPLPAWCTHARPQFVFLCLIYWIMSGSPYVRIGFAWFIGLVLDLLLGTVLGQYGIVFTLLAYVIIKIQRQMEYSPLLQQMLTIFILATCNLAISYLIKGFIGDAPMGWSYWLPAITTTLLWPVVHWLLGTVYNSTMLAVKQ